MREPSDNHPIIIRYFPGIIRFTQVNCLFSSTALKANRPKIGRQNPGIDRQFGSADRYAYRSRGVESSDNRQIASTVDRPSGPRNHQLIVNQFHLIINSAVLKLSPIHHQNGEIYHRAGGPPAIRLLESSDNHPTKRRNHPTESVNLPIIYRLISINYRFDRFAGVFAFRRRNPNHQLIINRFPEIINWSPVHQNFSKEVTSPSSQTRLAGNRRPGQFTGNLQILPGKSPILAGYSMRNQPKIYRRRFQIDRSAQAINCTQEEPKLQSTCNLEPCNPVKMPVPRCLIRRFTNRSIATKIVRGCNNLQCT